MGQQEAELDSVRSQLATEHEERERLAVEREELCNRLQGAEATVQQLAQQVRGQTPPHQTLHFFHFLFYFSSFFYIPSLPIPLPLNSLGLFLFSTYISFFLSFTSCPLISSCFSSFSFSSFSQFS